MKRTLTISLLALLGLALLALRLSPPLRAGVAGFVAPYAQGLAEFRWRQEQSGDLSRSKVELVAELDQLRAQVAQQTLGDAEMQQLRRENQELRRLLALPARDGFRVLAAQVLTQDPASGGRRLRVDRGSLNGVRIGQAVLAGGQLYGRVREVSATSAVVQTLADPQCKVSVWIPELGVHGILSGRGENDWLAEPVCEVRYLPRDREYLVGMEVQSSAYGEMVPVAIGIGVLASLPGQPVVRDFQHLYKVATLRPAALAERPGSLAILVPTGFLPAPVAPAEP